jgi:hypothetical protein
MIDGPLVGILKDAGPWVTLAAMVAFGWLIPRWSHKERINDHKERIKYLETALDHERQINDIQNGQLGKLLVLAEAGNKVLEALHASTTKEVA